jgi:hypothetical protein
MLIKVQVLKQIPDIPNVKTNAFVGFFTILITQNGNKKKNINQNGCVEIELSKVTF